MFTLGIVGSGQFASSFATLWRRHPGVGDIYATDLIPERAAGLAAECGLAGAAPSFEAMLASPIDAVAIFTQRWTHGPLVVQALRAGKHVYSAVPMGITEAEIADIVTAVRDTGLVYMMGETSHYHPATVYARERVADGSFGRLFYAEGDYLHDMELGLYEQERYSGGDNWKTNASFPPLLYPTHSIGGVLGAWRTHATTVSAIGVTDDRGDGVFDRATSRFDNDFSNATALFEVAGGGSFRTNEFRRVGYPAHIRESRFRFFGTEASLEQVATVSLWQDTAGVQDISTWLDTDTQTSPGPAEAQDRSLLPAELTGAPDGHEGSHHFLAHDFVTAVNDNTLPPVNAWVAARYTLPGITAHESARQGGARLPVTDFGDPPE